MTTYRYGFNGKENDNDVKGEGNQQDYGMRIYDPRVGRFLSVDPIAARYPELTPYQFASNRPIDGIDIDGKEWASETMPDINWISGQVKLMTTNYVKVKVINDSKLITNPDIIKAKAELFAQSVERIMTNVVIPFELPDEIISTKVILDYSAVKTDDLPTIGKLKFDDRKSIKTITNITQNGKPAILTTTSSTPGDTKGEINGFDIRIGITMDGKMVDDNDFILTSQHEGFHSAGGNHPWSLSQAEKDYSPEINQNDPINLKSRTPSIRGNIMNSAENPDPNFRSSSGKKLTPGQTKAVTEKIKSKSYYTPSEVKE